MIIFLHHLFVVISCTATCRMTHPSSTAKAARFNYHDDADADLVFKQRAMHNFCFLFLWADDDESALHQEVLVGSSSKCLQSKRQRTTTMQDRQALVKIFGKNRNKSRTK
jgi:hypothetical protein